ncbi:mutator mutT protein [Actinokineospora iranica]|uniref:8-oxo-dGTP diphosphatase n=1 Tax=Actinokineospora iranica TaxID=1271860 RepID=A0A1G6R886_9PSEU|nr:mutator mutT protein [Actinokineospora iranica]
MVGLCGGDRLLAPGDEVRARGTRLRVVEVGVGGLRAVAVGGLPGVSALEVVVEPFGAGARVSCVVDGWRPEAWARSVVERVAGRAVELASAAVVVGAAVVRDGRLLAQERAYPVDAAGKWELPGGRVEPGESDVDAVRRECAEELGISVAVGEPVGPDVVLTDALVLRVYAATLAGGEPEARDHRSVQWLTEGTLDTVDWLPADRVLLPALRALLR